MNSEDNIKNFKIDSSKYEKSDNIINKYTAPRGINEDIVIKISKDKNEPNWMLKKRLKALELFKKTKKPTWGVKLENIDLDKIIYYADPNTTESKNWDDVPEDIKETFNRLGIPEAEKTALSGVGAQYDSSMVYHNLKKEWKEKGIIFENMDVAIKKYPFLVKKYFMTSCVPINDHKFVMLHAAVWSGGTFIYVPENTKIDMPLQAYFRMNQKGGGQFEHTLIIADKNSEVHYIEGCSAPKYSENSLHAGCVEIHILQGAKVKYSSIENWSKNTYNLNTKRAIVHKDAIIEWINGNLGSGNTMLYPCSILIGENSKSTSLGIAFAGSKQNQDTGSKVIHIGKNTSSLIKAKSISKDGGISTYRGIVRIASSAINSVSHIECDAIMIGENSISNTFPENQIENSTSQITHEAKVGKIGNSEIFYLQSKGFTCEQAKQLIVRGFSNEIIKKLPLEYAIELNKLIELEMQSNLG